MKMKIIFKFDCILTWAKAVVVGALLIGAQAAFSQPRIELPEEEPPRPVAQPKLKLPRETAIEVPLDEPAMIGSALGGYGELVLNAPSNAPTVVDLRRLVLYVGHNFNARIRLYAEVEFDHAVTSASDQGEIEVEQAYLDVLGWRALNLRAGVILLPVGIINIYHEPPTFNGADRPDTDLLVIPSTWREPGAGIFGGVYAFRYQLYVVNGLKASGFNAVTGLRDGRQEAQLALGHDWGVVGRVDWSPWLPANVGAALYYSNAAQGQARFRGSDGDDVPVTVAEADASLRFRGFEARAEVASVWIGGIHRLNRALAAAATMDNPFEGPVSHQLLGAYVEAGYNLLSPLKLKWGSSLVPFARYEHVDTQAEVPSGFTRNLGNKRDTLTLGLTVRPIPEVALKLDYQRRWTDAEDAKDAAVNQLNAALGYMF